MTNDEIRAAFEVEYTKGDTKSVMRGAIVRSDNGDYLYSPTRFGWKLWQAAWAAAGARIVELELELEEYKARRQTFCED